MYTVEYTMIGWSILAALYSLGSFKQMANDMSSPATLPTGFSCLASVGLPGGREVATEPTVYSKYLAEAPPHLPLPWFLGCP